MNFDHPLAARTFQTYALALPLTVEGAFFTPFGYLISLLALFALTSPFRGRSVEAEA